MKILILSLLLILLQNPRLIFMLSFDVPILFALLAFPLWNALFSHDSLSPREASLPCSSGSSHSAELAALWTTLSFQVSQVFISPFPLPLSPTRYDPWSHYGPSYLETRGVPRVSQRWLKEPFRCLMNTELLLFLHIIWSVDAFLIQKKANFLI